MRDEHVGEASVLLQVLQKVQDLCLDGNIQRRYRLIADDEFRMKGKRTGDTDSLAASAVQLVRIGAFQSFRKTDQLHHIFRLLFHVCL